MNPRVKKHFIGVYHCAKHGNMVSLAENSPECSLCEESGRKANFFTIDESESLLSGREQQSPQEKRLTIVKRYLNLYSANFLANCYDGQSVILYGAESKFFRGQQIDELNQRINESAILRSAVLKGGDLEFLDKSNLDFFIITDINFRTPRSEVRHFLLELMSEQKAFVLNMNMTKREMVAYLGEEVIHKLKGYSSLLLFC